MKQLLSLFALIMCGGFAQKIAAQTTPPPPTPKVGINTDHPTEILHVEGTMRLRLLPKKGDRKIYTRPDGTGSDLQDQPYAPTGVVVADDNGVLGTSQQPPYSFFYMPAVYLPTSPQQVQPPVTYAANTEVYSLDLYKEYKEQYSGVYPESSAKSPSATELPIENSAGRLAYFVTYYDNTVFYDVSINSSGILKYKIKDNAVTSARSYMNIVLRQH